MTTNKVESNEVVDTTAPEKIWLNVGDEGNYKEATENNYAYEEICWCEDKQFDRDVKYIRADLVQHYEQENTALKAQVNKLREALEDADESIGRFISDEGSTQKDFDTSDHITHALAETEHQSLAEHDAEVLDLRYYLLNLEM